MTPSSLPGPFYMGAILLCIMYVMTPYAYYLTTRDKHERCRTASVGSSDFLTRGFGYTASEVQQYFTDFLNMITKVIILYASSTKAQRTTACIYSRKP